MDVVVETLKYNTINHYPHEERSVCKKQSMNMKIHEWKRFPYQPLCYTCKNDKSSKSEQNDDHIAYTSNPDIHW